MMRKLVLLMILAILLGAGWMWSYARQPLPLPTTPFAFELKPGSNLKASAHELKRAGLLTQDWAFVWLARLLGKDAQIKAGPYELERPLTPLQLLDKLAKGEVVQRQLAVIEGWTFAQMRAAVDASPDLAHDSRGVADSEILQRIGATESHPEGLFFPDTYRFAVGSSDFAVYRQAYQSMQQRLQELWEGKEVGLPLKTPYQALILASIVEKETGTPEDRPMIAGVFVNRLRIGMLLQTDPTVIYGLGKKFDGNLRKRDLLADTPYNTYTRAGLTPTPIAMPGEAALQAALHPAKTDALYFVARGDGSSQFSSSLAAHNRAVDKYQK